MPLISDLVISSPPPHHNAANNVRAFQSKSFLLQELYASELANRESGLGSQLDKNMPGVAGTILWTEKLKLRVEEPIAIFMALEHP